MKHRWIWLAWIILIAFLSNRIPVGISDAGWMEKIEPGVMVKASGSEVEYLLYLEEQADLTQASLIPDILERKQFVFKKLTETAFRTQKPVVSYLASKGVKFQAYWVANMIWVRGDETLLKNLAKREDINFIYANPKVTLSLPSSTSIDKIQNADGIEWNISLIHAPDVWAEGFTGQGVVIGGQDTGYDWDHPALKIQYRGWDGNSVDHSYSWHDSIHSGSSSCGLDSLEPCDDHGHGTHTMGTMVGDDGTARKVGVAPGARWIGCRNMAGGVGTPATYTECYQWFMAPTDLNGENPRPDLAPDIISNSWSCPKSEGCTEPQILRQVVENVRLAGILTVHSAGNDGPGCNSVQNPAAIYEASFTVGATDSSNQIASFSSRGSVSVDDSGRMKPNVTAPGVNILSSTRGGGYGTMSGTSMAAPHVAGLAALLVSAYPEISGNVDLLEDLIEQSSFGSTTTQSCDGSGNTIPNNTYGWGRVDTLAAYLAYKHQVDIQKTASADVVQPGDELTYTIHVQHEHFNTAVHNLTLQDEIPSGTTFLSSDTPHNQSGGILTWKLDKLEASDSWDVNFTVSINSDATGWIENAQYNISSDELQKLVVGPVLRTFVKGFREFLPMVLNK